MEKLQVSLKGPANFVTAADRRAEDILRTELMKARPGYGFIGEEGGKEAGEDGTHTWIVDPLDGTYELPARHSAVRNFHRPAARRHHRRRASFTIRSPTNCSPPNAARAHSSTISACALPAVNEWGDAVVACGLPHMGRGDLKHFLKEFSLVQERVAGLRRFGSAALDLAWTAAGRLDIYWERNLSAWDMAAGILLVREAGGFVSDCDGRDTMLVTGDIVAGNETMQRELVSLLRAAAAK